MVDIAIETAIQQKVDALRNTVRGFGWIVAASDTRGDQISVTLTMPRETVEQTQKLKLKRPS